MGALDLKNLAVTTYDKSLIHNLSMRIPKGEVHGLMGPNGAGKSSLAKAISGHPDYKITAGNLTIDGTNIVGLNPDEIARHGLFLAFQYPLEIEGVTVANLIRAAVQARHMNKKISIHEFYENLYECMDRLKMDRSFSSRQLNMGFSGGEKKRCEILQLMMLKPKIAILDEPDSGLDMDAMKILADGINSLRDNNFSALIITHYPKFLDQMNPDKIHLMAAGKIVHSGNKSILKELEIHGYNWINKDS
ncbi:MAG: Fe-S cluster assembly ATPase SufC [Puniceicoccales bacterium]|jgi:Fe-S cluster assembly ATP-binding protein|nr:Fe-S cluster assembly ATPase SufC [Puniceicoccales bacterium]